MISLFCSALFAEEAAYDPHGKRDPFVPLVSSGSSPASGLLGVESIDDVTIEGVVYDPRAGSVVILNGSLMKEGDEIGNLKVVKVRPDGAVLSVNGTESFKPMFQEQASARKTSAS